MHIEKGRQTRENQYLLVTAFQVYLLRPTMLKIEADGHLGLIKKG